jgi:prepilin-type N-terminal cleavage/methylation domain-containing protein
MKTNRTPWRASEGFTVIEVVTTLAIAAILITMGLDSLGTAADRTGIRSAAREITAFGARARAVSIERGQRVRLHFDMAGDSVWIATPTETLDVIRFAEQGVDLRSVRTSASLCMTPKGYADIDCNSFTGPLYVLLERGAEHLDMTVLPLGQINGG